MSAVFTNAQAQQPKLEGLGKLKVGKTTLAVIPELEADLKTKVKRATTFEETYGAKKNSILELIPDTVSRYNSVVYSSECPGAKVYSLNSYKVADIEITGLRLTFFNNTLVKLECDGSPDLREALKLKYGEGKLKTQEKDVHCTFVNTGNNIAYKDLEYTQSYDSAPLEAALVLHKFYDDKCKQMILNYLLVYDPEAMKLVHEGEKKSRERRTSTQNIEKKKKLSDL